MAWVLPINAMREAGIALASINVPDGYVVMASGLVLPIVGYYDDEWTPTGDLEEAVYYEFGTIEIGFATAQLPEDPFYGAPLH
jgi:hypothetical protein